MATNREVTEAIEQDRDIVLSALSKDYLEDFDISDYSDEILEKLMVYADRLFDDKLEDLEDLDEDGDYDD